MDKFFEYIETNIKLAYKGVTFHFKQYIWFYVVLLIIQCMFGTVFIAHNTANNVVKEQLNKSYDSHYVFYYLNTDQMLYMKKSSEYVFADEYLFDITHTEIKGKATDRNCKYNIGITFVGDPKEGYESFSRRYLPSLEQLGEVRAEPTPLYSIGDYTTKINIQQNLYIVFLIVISTLLLSVLYGIRINNYRFDYGIYMVFGADKRKLLKTSFWEMTVIALLTFIPSLLLSSLVAFWITGRLFGLFGITLKIIFLLLIITLGINALAISFAVIKTSRKKPIDLIVSADNSNYVHSPRVSVDVLSGKSLFKLIRLSMLRYYKYYIGMIFAGVCFSAVFVALFFSKDMFMQKHTDIKKQFTLDFYNGYTYTDEDYQKLISIDGIALAEKEHLTAAGELNRHILVKKENTKKNSSLANFNDEYDAMDNVSFVATDREVIEQLKTTEYIGDLNSVLDSDNTIIITDSFTNKTMLDFEPGDKIKIANFLGKTDDLTPYLVGNDLLKEKLIYNLYGYDEYTVGAVIKNSTSNNNIKIYLPDAEYEKITGKTVEYNSVDLYVDSSLNEKQITALYNTLISYVDNQYNSGKDINAFIKNTYGNVSTSIDDTTHNERLLCVIAILLLSCSQLVWVFSQKLFYKKRTNEFSVMRVFGFKMSEIGNIHLLEGAFVAILGSAVYIGFSFVICYLIKRFMNSMLFGYSYRYLTNVPTDVLLIGAVITFVCGFVSAYVPYVIYKRKSRNTIPEQ